MLPPPQFRSQCLRLPKSSVASLLVSALLVATATTIPAQAQVTAAPEESSIAPAQTTPLPTQGPPIAFEADRVEYADGTESVTAAGNVVLRREGRSLKADSVTWSRKTGKITASGNVRLVDQDGNQLFVDKLDLTDEFETGSMENMLLALREGGRLAALSGERTAEGNILLDHAAYSACDVEDEHGCPKKPSWRVTSKKVVYEPATKTVRFRGARLELFGIRLMPLPGLAIATDGRAVSGLLIPNFRFTPSNGLEISESYYQRLANNRDIAATAYFYTKAAPMASLQYRALTDKGAYQVSLYGTSSTLIPVAGTTSASQRELRGYVFANGRFQLSPNWSVTASLRRATDRTFLRRYDISRDDRLRSMIEVERIDPNSYLSIAGWATQTLRTGDNQGLVPVALPALDYWRRFAGPILGGKLEFHANSLGIMRTAGQDTQRAFASAQWDIRRLTNAGQVLSLTALVRGDVYHSSDNGLTATAIYRGSPGWQTRGIATAAFDAKWPLVGSLFGGTQVLTPRIQIVASPTVRNLAVPNEDSRAIDLQDSNLFALNRFPGYDRIEDGVRFTLGFDWQFDAPRWRIKSTVGQSYRLTSNATLLPDGTGLSNRASDVVGRTEIEYRNFVKLTHRFRIDKDSGSFRRNEIDATFGSQSTYIELGYSLLDRNISAAIEDLKDSEELRAAGRIAFARYWSLFGSGVFSLSENAKDIQLIGKGFQPLRTRLGIGYQDDCLELGLTWRRDFVTTGDARQGDTFEIRFALRNLGFR
jgi:LPS-assembly protein